MLFRMRAAVHLLPPATAAQSDRAIALPRLLKQQGLLKELTVPIAAASGGR